MRIPRTVKFLVGCAAWWTDALLQTFAPVEQLPTIDEMAAQLAEREAEEEVADGRPDSPKLAKVAAFGLREWLAGEPCDAPTYFAHIIDDLEQLAK